MMEHFRKFAKFGLIIAPMLLPIITADSGHEVNLDAFSDRITDHFKNGNVEQLDMKDNPFLNASESARNELNKRLRDVAIDMVRLGYA